MNRIDSLFEGCSFNLDGKCHTIREFRNGMAVCEREDGSIVYLHGWEHADEWKPSRNLFSRLSFLVP